MKSLSKKFKGIVLLFWRMKGGWRGGEGMPLHYRNPHRQGVSTTNERRKGETGFPLVRWKNTAGFSGFSHRMTSHWWESPGTGIAPCTCRGLLYPVRFFPSPFMRVHARPQYSNVSSYSLRFVPFKKFPLCPVVNQRVTKKFVLTI